MSIELHDALIANSAGPEPVFDTVMQDFLCNSRDELVARAKAGGLLQYACLGHNAPWLWRLTFGTRGRACDGEEPIGLVERHVVAVRFLPDYLRRADRFEMLRLVEPVNAFHPNLRQGAICVQIYPGEPLVEIAESLHRLISWRLVQLNEFDAMNKDACAWGRAQTGALPVDDRPLFGRAFRIQLEDLKEAV